jgi:SAM-dependent methyltransferase
MAKLYIGVDYSEPMIAACRKKFPHLQFETGSAVDLSKFRSSNFDAVVMAFNVIDYIFPENCRTHALQEIHRVLKPNGIFIFSSHNPRAMLVRASWNTKRVRGMAESFAGRNPRLFCLILASLTVLRAVVAWLQAFRKSLGRIFRKLPARFFWTGRGYSMDPAHGGLTTFYSTPVQTVRELEANGFHVVQIMGDDYPRTSHLYSTDWYYYVFSRTETIGEK